MKIEITSEERGTLRQLISLSDFARAAPDVKIVATSQRRVDFTWSDWRSSIEDLASDEYDNDWETKTTTFRNGSTVRFVEEDR